MTSVPSSGALRLSSLATIFGASPTNIRISSLKRGGSFVPNGPSANVNIPTSTLNMKFSGFYGSIKVLTLIVSATTTNYNVLNSIVAAYGTLTGSIPVQLTINSGVTIGATSTSTAALTVGQFPAGSTITIINNGLIYGAGGAGGGGSTSVGTTAGSGGAGGTAIQANYLNQTVTITNNGTIYGGGGGGGGGGKGATGGSGSNGTGAGTFQFQLGRYTWWSDYGGTYSRSYAKVIWNGSQAWIVDFNPNIESPYAGYYKGDLMRSTDTSDSSVYQYSVAQGITCYGGAGGAGGNGGSGATGRGYNNLTNALTGAGGAGGAAGAGPSCGYASSGATGATGGSGGASGNWGAAGSNGGGSSVGAGGAAGAYLLKGSATVTLTGGTIGGSLA